MKSVIYEYSGVLIALIGAVGILQLFEVFLLGNTSFMAEIIKVVLQGGI